MININIVICDLVHFEAGDSHRRWFNTAVRLLVLWYTLVIYLTVFPSTALVLFTWSWWCGSKQHCRIQCDGLTKTL